MAEPPTKRFRYESYSKQISHLKVDTGKLKPKSWEVDPASVEEDEAQTVTPLTTALSDLSLIHLTTPYVQLTTRIIPLCRNLPLTLLNASTIQGHFHDFFAAVTSSATTISSGVDGVLVLYEAFFSTVLGEGLPFVRDATFDLLRIGGLAGLEAKLIELCYSSLSSILKTSSSSIFSLPPTQREDNLRELWSCFSPYFTASKKSYVRKCAAEVWSVVLRRARGETSSTIVKIMVQDAFVGTSQRDKEEQEIKHNDTDVTPMALAAVLADSMKGAPQLLHSRAVHLYTVMLQHLLWPSSGTNDDQNAAEASTSAAAAVGQTTAEGQEQVLKTMVLLTTSLIHHCSSEAMAPIHELVLSLLKRCSAEVVNQKSPFPSGRLESNQQRLVLRLVAVLVSVRKGQRIPTREKTSFLLEYTKSLTALLPSVSRADMAGVKEYIRSAVGCLVAGKLGDWIKSGVGLIDGMWNVLSVEMKFRFVRVLVKLKWKGLEQFLLGHVAKTCSTSLSTHPLATTSVLASLAENGFLDGGLLNIQAGRWKDVLAKAVGSLMETLSRDWSGDDDQVKTAKHIFKLLPKLSKSNSSFSEALGDLLRTILDHTRSKSTAELQSEFSARALGCAHVLSAGFSSVADLREVGAQLHAVEDLIRESSEGVLERLSWHRQVLREMGRLVGVWVDKTDASRLKQLAVSLAPQLSSEDHLLRQSALTILAAFDQPKLPPTDPAANHGSGPNFFCLGLEVEEAGMSLQNVRERTTKIRAIGTASRTVNFTGEEHVWLLETVVKYLISQLKVNFRPLYPETIAVLKELAEHHSETVWSCTFAQLELCMADKTHLLRLVAKPEWASTAEQADEDAQSETVEDEKSFICPNAGKLDKSVELEVEGQESTVSDPSVMQQITDDRLDVLNYEAQLLALLGNIASVAERHARSLVPMLLQLGAHKALGQDDSTDDHLSVRSIHAKLLRHLELFAKFSNPKALFRADEVQALYLRTLSMGDLKLQETALDCVLTYKAPGVAPYADPLRNLLKENKFRDELAKFSLGQNSGEIDPVHRPELVPVVTRILYGIMTARRGRNSASQGPTQRKNAVLAAIAGYSSEEFKTLVDLMLAAFPRESVPNVQDFKLVDGAFASVSPKQKSGYLSLLGDVLRHLGPQIVDHWSPLLSVTLQIVHEAQADISKETDIVEQGDDEESHESSASSRNLRTLGLKRFGDFFLAPVAFDFTPYLPAAFRSIISPRVGLLDRESTQAPSAMMELFVTWALQPDKVRFLVDYDNRVLPKLFACLAAPKVKPTVCGRVMDAVERLIVYSQDEASPDGYVTANILKPHVGCLLEAMMTSLRNATQITAVGRDVLFRREVAALARVADFVEDPSQAQLLTELLLPTLRRPSKHVSEALKVDILTALVPLLRLTPSSRDPSSKFFQHSLSLVSTLFRSLNGRLARMALCKVFQVFAESLSDLAPVSALVVDLNAFSGKRMDEPDFEKRLKAFAVLNDELHSTLTTDQWIPLLYNLFFYIQDAQEFSIRSNAGLGLRRFVQWAIRKDTAHNDEVILNILYPALRNVLNSKHELVRGEAMSVLSAMVQLCQRLPVFAELVPLLARGDEEASFFSNIYHIQVHRRVRALRRLGDYIETGAVRESTLVGVFLPVVTHFIRQAADGLDHHLINEAIACLGKIARQLGWSKYLATTLQLLRQAKVKTPGQKFYIRALTTVLENFHFAMEDSAVGSTSAEDQMTEAVVNEHDDVEAEAEAEDKEEQTRDIAAVQYGKVVEYLSARLLPTLAQFLEQKDEAEATIRIPVALGIIKVALALPEESRATEISRILTILSQVLRSKDQDTRDLVKDTMCKAARVLGPLWLAQVIRDLRSALQRGPQLHVLAVVTHAILVHVTTEAPEAFNNLDDAVGDIVHVSAEVIWGQSGKDVVAEGFKSKMREVKSASSRAYDCFQLVSRLVSPTRISSVLVPLRNIMRETAAVQPMQQVDDALRRISTGLNANVSLGPVELLRLCHTLMNSSADFIKPTKPAAEEKGAAGDYRVQMKRKLTTDVDHSAENIHRFVAFGLDLFVTAFRRGKFDFADPEILSRLSPLVGVIGNTLYSSSTLVQGLALKASAAIVRCPLPAVDRTMPTFVKQIFAVIKRCGSAESELAQTAIKSLAVIIRDCKSAELKEQQLTYLLGIIGPDLEEPDRQAALFTLLRAILSRRFVVPEIYDLMEKVSAIMVTSQSAHVQELCRSALIQFLLDYPQGKGRLRAQMTFLAQNLSYVYESGRVSVMELLAAVFSKFSENLVQDYADLFFLALVMVTVNDDAEKCRAMAGELLKQLLKFYDGDRLEDLLEMLSQWTSNATDNPALARAAMIVAGLLLQATSEPEPSLVSRLVNQVNVVIKLSATALREAEATEPDSPFAPELHMDFALPHQALIALARCLDADKMAYISVNWSDLLSLLLFPHDWVRLASARSIVRLLSAQDVVLGGSGQKRKSKVDVILSPSGLLDLARKSCILLSSRNTKGPERYVPSEALCSEVVKILFSIGQRWTATVMLSTDGNTQAPNGEATDSEANSDAEEAVTDVQQGRSPLPWLMSRLSFVARNLIIGRPSGHEQNRSYTKWTPPLSAILKFFAAMTDVWVPSGGDGDDDVDMGASIEVDGPGRDLLIKYLPHILSPLYRVLDEEGDVKVVEGDSELENLNVLATEVREHIRSKAGMTAFSRVWEELRKKTVAKRGGRRRERDDLAVADPQAYAKRKEKRGEMKRENKKRRVKSFADTKMRERPLKRRK